MIYTGIFIVITKCKNIEIVLLFYQKYYNHMIKVNHNNLAIKHILLIIIIVKRKIIIIILLTIIITILIIIL